MSTIQHPPINFSSFNFCEFLLILHFPQPKSTITIFFYSTEHISKERRKMTIAASLSRLHSPFIYCPLKISTSSCHRTIRNQRSSKSYPCIRAIDLDQNTVVAISVGVVSIAVGIGIPVFYETQIDSAAKRENTQPCFPCNGSGAQKCRFCTGTGNVSVELGGGEKEVSRCINCDGAGSLTCTTCQGNGIQPRYLDRREFKDDD